MASLDDYADNDDGDGVVESLIDFIKNNLLTSIMLGIGIICILLGGVLFVVIDYKKEDVEILGVTTDSERGTIIVEVSGAINSPGVYELQQGSRVIELLEIAGGFSDEVDTVWTAQFLNKARPVEDGEKVFIPAVSEQSEEASAREFEGHQSVSSGNYAENEKMVNINTSTIEELESLWGIGRITAQNIVDQRPYSRIEELLEKKILKENVYERNKNMFSVYP